tara:strand:- start:588 stop:962 length:375 start_codon:yes stop_codon:yes gene_type:complete
MNDTLPPLTRELGFERGMKCWFRDLPDDVRNALAPEKAGLEELAAPSAGIEGALIFVDDSQTLTSELNAFHELLDTNGFVWVAFGGELTESAVLDAASPCDMVHAGSVTLAGRRAVKLAHQPGH